MTQNKESKDTAPCKMSKHQLFDNLKSDHLIKIFIGVDTTPILVQETALRQASDYFGKAIDNAERLGSGDRHLLRFPKDSIETWKILLFWIFNRDLSDEERLDMLEYASGQEPQCANSLCRAWIAADMYLIPRLQNKIMAELLSIYSRATASWDTAKTAMLGTAPDSALRRLYAEEFIHMLREDIVKTSDLDELEGVTGLTRSILDAGRLYDDHSELYYLRSENDSELWSEYMVKEA